MDKNLNWCSRLHNGIDSNLCAAEIPESETLIDKGRLTLVGGNLFHGKIRIFLNNIKASHSRVEEPLFSQNLTILKYFTYIDFDNINSLCQSMDTAWWSGDFFITNIFLAELSQQNSIRPETTLLDITRAHLKNLDNNNVLYYLFEDSGDVLFFNRSFTPKIKHIFSQKKDVDRS